MSGISWCSLQSMLIFLFPCVKYMYNFIKMRFNHLYYVLYYSYTTLYLFECVESWTQLILSMCKKCMWMRALLSISNEGCTHWSRTMVRHIPIHIYRHQGRCKYRGGNPRNRLECNGRRSWFSCSLCSIPPWVFASPVPIQKARVITLRTTFHRQSFLHRVFSSLRRPQVCYKNISNEESQISLPLSLNQISLKFRKRALVGK